MNKGIGPTIRVKPSEYGNGKIIPKVKPIPTEAKIGRIPRLNDSIL